MTRSYVRSSKMAKWPQHPALILESGAKKINWVEGMEPSYEPRVLYQYRVNDQDYESERYGLRGSPRSKTKALAAEMAAEFPVGSITQCWVDPQNPHMSILKLDSRAAGYSLWFPGLFFLGGVGMIVGAWKKTPVKRLA